MSYLTAVEFLYGLHRHGIKLGLDTITALLAGLGHPERRFPSMHIGGTNGKGSTAAIVASILQAAGYRVGLYTSPHLVDFCERIQVNGSPIEDERVAVLTERLRAAAGESLDPTFFEFTTAMAFQQFADAGIDVAVVEVGLGGRFDATNVLTPAVSAITNVALDHQEYLGHTIPAIAYEKAGIIKPGVPVVVGRVDEDAATVIARVAEERGAPLRRLARDFLTEGGSSVQFRYAGMEHSWDALDCPLDGRHQLDNTACALAMLEVASGRGVPIAEPAVREGLRQVRWEGRLETVERRPWLVLDGAHNPAAAAVVAAYLDEFRREHGVARVIAVLGMMRDKDREEFFAQLLPQVDEVIVTQARVPRAAAPHELGASATACGRTAHLMADPHDALALARRMATPDDLILVTGSLMLVGEVKALLRGCELSPLRG
ncbi:MAG: bifunctional folylpolyglutamate synthase/dihydrofolate synthase [Nitrospiraceae bacterium]